MVFITGSFVYFVYLTNNNNDNNKQEIQFYRWGPNEGLMVLGIPVDTPLKYTAVVLYSFVNNIIRNMNTNILKAWITHHIQDETPEGRERKVSLNKGEAYQINTVYTFYVWFDFLIYIHLLLAQIDLFLFEALSDVVIITVITHYWYLGGGRVDTRTYEPIPL